MPKAKPDRDETRLRNAVVGELALRLASQVIEGCGKRDITLMPLKGVLLLSRWPALLGRRDLVDIDLLVRASDIQTVNDVLRALGFEPTICSSAGCTFSSEAWPLSIDLHHSLFPHGLFRVSTDAVFARAEIDPSLFAAPVARMSDEDLFAHLIGHFVKGRGIFRADKSLDDIRWLLSQGIFPLEEADVVGSHLRKLGLQRAAGYVLGHESFRDDPIACAILGSLALTWLDQRTIAIAHLGANTKGGSPRWWTPHLLDRSLVAGSRSLLEHAHEAVRRITKGIVPRRGATWRTRSATEATR